jgi:predicted ribosomally synthesized peptide with nif11-like leader
MSQTDAVAFLERVETDEELARDLASRSEDRPAVLERIRSEGFDVEPEEVREAFLERYGAELTPEQMDMVAAGYTAGEIGAMAGGSVAVLGTLIGIAAIAGGF